LQARAIFSPDGRYIAAGSANGSIFIWNCNSGFQEAILQQHNAVVSCCTWSTTFGFASCDKNKTLMLWE